jgi:hypothetical protein
MRIKSAWLDPPFIICHVKALFTHAGRSIAAIFDDHGVDNVGQGLFEGFAAAFWLTKAAAKIHSPRPLMAHDRCVLFKWMDNMWNNTMMISMVVVVVMMMLAARHLFFCPWPSWYLLRRRIKIILDHSFGKNNVLVITRQHHLCCHITLVRHDPTVGGDAVSSGHFARISKIEIIILACL